MKTIKDFDLKGKKVLIRVDFNVPIKDGKILDDTRIVESLKTIKYAKDNKAKIVLFSHLGRIKTSDDKLINSLKPVAKHLSDLLGTEVIFSEDTRGEKLENLVSNLKDGDVLLVENTRFEDLDGKKESSNDLELGKYWASLGDVFINDAFGTIHRSHASNVGIASNIDSGIGFLVEKELEEFKCIDNPERPFTIILGGSKVSDKIGVIANLVTKADYILIGGAMANTFLKASDINIGFSLIDLESIDFCKRILNDYEDKIILPIDAITNQRECFISDIKDDEISYDIGSQTLKLFKQYLQDSKTIIWNGPVGMFEDEKYSTGTKGICSILKDIDAIKIAGGGDTASAVKQFGYEEVFTHISTGGGASLELLEGKELPGLAILK